ncbi:MAG TPA: ChaN family lipoprotein, partial [Candidatus Krumholzibacterium sp.]|nr:ChaN family lipoprotein [Candidatus Krumholzibacterium sp.]
MAPGKNVKNEIDAQKIMVSRLKEEIFGEDKSGASPYISEFLSEYGAYRSICTVEDVYVSAMRSDVVYFGDYHPLGASQRWAVSLISGMAARGADVVLAMEMLYTHQQEFLDRYMKETSSEEEFLRVIDYDSEWGFDW